jgi:cysteine desulfurase
MAIKRAYLDHGASSPTRDSAVRAIEPFYRGIYANAASNHALGREARASLEMARERVASLMGADSKEIVFTSGGTESIILANVGASAGNKDRGMHILTSSFEHHAVHSVLDFIRDEMGFEYEMVEVDSNGMLQLDELKSSIRDDTVLVSVMVVNNEIGTIQDIKAISDICKNKRIIFHSDYVQAVGKLAVDFHKSGVDLASVSGHKFGGPKGTGFLYIKDGTTFRPICKSSHESGMRAGTVNVGGVVGMSVALEEAIKERNTLTRRLDGFRSQIWERIQSFAPDARINGSFDKGVASILNVRFPGCSGESMVLMLDREGIEVSTASACLSADSEPSHVLKALGLSYLDALSSVRISMGWSTSQDEIDYFCEAIPEVYDRVKTSGDGVIKGGC